MSPREMRNMLRSLALRLRSLCSNDTVVSVSSLYKVVLL